MKMQKKTTTVLFFSLLSICLLFVTKQVQATVLTGKNVSGKQTVKNGRNTISTTTDVEQKNVLEKCVSLLELQQYLPKNADASYKQLIVMQHAVSFIENNGAVHEGNTILYKSKGDIKGNNTDAYFYFNTFNIDANTARAEFTFYYDQNTAAPKMAVVEIILAKTSNVWAITNSKINIQ